MKKSTILLAEAIGLLLIAITLPSCNRNRTHTEEAVANDTIYPLGFCTDSFDVIEGTVRSGEVFTSLVTRVGMSATDAYNLASVVDSAFDMRKLRAGNGWKAYFHADSNEVGAVEYLVYDADRVNTVVFKCSEPYDIWKVSKPIERQRLYAEVSIQSSLWNDMIAANVSPLLIVKLSEIYAWSIDFFGLQKDDRFQVIYEQEVCEGEVIDVHTIYYALFSHAGKEYPAIMLDPGDGGNIYWNDKGESLKKAFLKAPLKFTRISSGFSYHRKHPVTGQVKAHTGVDYAAPLGTPVMAVGDGTIISRGWGGGGGNTVKIKHNSIYTTGYLHLSRFAAGQAVGTRVHQGDVIGYVGSTGTSTGPHLDYRVWKNGTPINPLTMESPPTEPLPASLMPALDSVITLYRAEMDSLSLAWQK